MSWGRQGHRRVGAAAAFALIGLAGCGSGDEVSSPSTTQTGTTQPAPTTAPPTTAPSTTVAPSTAPPTTAAATTVPPPTAPPPTTPPLTTPPPATAPTDLPTTAFVAANQELLEVDAVTGATVRVIDELFSTDGVVRGRLQLSPDRTTIWFDEGREDSWFACETSVGRIGRIDVATGVSELIGSGFGIEPSPDGEFVSFVTSSICLPDPANPDFFVITPGDRVVVRDVATGQDREYVTAVAPDDYDAPGAVLDASWSPDGRLLVLLGDRTLYGVDIDGSGVLQDHPVAASDVVGALVAATADAIITLEFGDEGSTDLYSRSPATPVPTLLSSTGAFAAVGVSDAGDIVMVSSEPVTVAPGATVTVLELPGDPFVYDIDW